MTTSYLNYGRVLRLAAERHGDRPFLVDGPRSYDYSTFNALVNKLSNALQARGVGYGDRIAVLSYNSARMLQLIFAGAKLGAVVVPLNTMLTATGVKDLLAMSQCSVLAVGAGFQKIANQCASELEGIKLVLHLHDQDVNEPAPNDAVFADLLASAEDREMPVRADDDELAMLLFTSGSTGRPKAIAKSYSQLAWSAINLQLAEPRSARSVELFAVPLSGIGFANFILADVLAGAKVVLMERFDAERAVDLIADQQVTHTFLAPTMILAMLETPGMSPQKLESVRAVDVAYEMTMEQRLRACEMFSEASFVYGYGMTEGTMNRTPHEWFVKDVSCVGIPGGLDECRIVDENGQPAPPGTVGEILVYGPTVMMGYLGDELEAVRDDGWFSTGDLGRLESNGMLHFEGRVKDMIKTGGYNVFAADVERALLDCPAVREVAVVGVPHPYWGEAVIAVVVGAGDRESEDLDAVGRWASGALESYKRPKYYVFVDALPQNPGGKVAKGELRDRYGALFATAGGA